MPRRNKASRGAREATTDRASAGRDDEDAGGRVQEPRAGGRPAPGGPLLRALRHTLHPPGTTSLQVALGKVADAARPPGVRERAGCQDAAARRLVLELLDGPCSRPLRPGRAGTCVKAKGRVNANLHGAWVFTYDQRIAGSSWDQHSVLCRGLLVIFPSRALVAEGFPEADLVPGACLHLDNNSLLRRLCTSEARHACRIFEPMPKFWEAGRDNGGGGGGEVTWGDVAAACGGGEPRLVRLEEKVDGNLGTLYPQLDAELEPVPDAPPLLSTKGIAHSPDIERQTSMLRTLYPNLRLPVGVSHAIVEVVDVEMKVCVPYAEPDAGARLIAASAGKSWLPCEAADELAAGWGMPRPATRPLGAGLTLGSAMDLASEYSLMPGHLLVEGFVLHIECPPAAELIRLKIHTHVWNTVHGWWEDNPSSSRRITVCSVMPVLLDRRFAAAGVEAIKPSLVKYRSREEAPGRVPCDRLALRFEEAVRRAAGCLSECLSHLGGALAWTASVPSGRGLVRFLEGMQAAAEWRALSQAKLSALRTCVLTIRSIPGCGLDKGLGEQHADALTRTLRGVYGGAVAENRSTVAENGNACGIGADGRALARALEHTLARKSVQRLMDVWGVEAQAAWDAEVAAGAVQ